MWVGKAVRAVFIALLIVQLQLAHAAAPDAGTAHKTNKKKTKAKRGESSAAKKQHTRSAAKKASSRKRQTVAKSRKARKTAASKTRRARKTIAARSKRRVAYRHVKHAPAPVVPSAGTLAGLDSTRDPLDLSSNVAFVLDEANSAVLFEKNADVALPIASLTKLMTALVVVEADQDMNEILEVTTDDIDRIKHTSSRLPIGAKLRRADMLHIALMSSENRAASALGRNYPGGLPAFVAAMNAKAKELGMARTHYVEPTGLSSDNVSTARDLAKLVIAAHQHPRLSRYSTHGKYAVDTGRHTLQYVNSNRLIRYASDEWDIGLQKTGYIREAGRCLVMQAKIDERDVVMVFLDSDGPYSRFADARRLRKWVLENTPPEPTARMAAADDQS